MQNLYHLNCSNFRHAVLCLVNPPTTKDDQAHFGVYSIPYVKEMLQSLINSIIQTGKTTGCVDFFDIDIRDNFDTNTAITINPTHTRFHLVFCFKEGVSINITKLRVTEDQQVIREFINFRSDDIDCFSLEPVLQFICNVL